MSVPCWGCKLTPNRYHEDPGPGYSGSGTTHSGSLKVLTSAEADFRANDRDGNGVHDFWRKDIAGFYAMPGVDGKPLKLIELSTALADERPVWSLATYGVPGPKRGYRLRAIRHEDEDPKKLDPQRFAFAALPVAFPRHYKYAYIVDEENTVYRTDDPANFNVTVFPKDPGKAGWSKQD